ncbi:MAG: hypothetical protein ACR2I2_13310 [Bryobacteraceae bacterium]
MSAQELVGVVFGGGLIWKLRKLQVFAVPGPNISLTNRNTARGDDKYPQVLEIENVGDKVAQSIEWEIREYNATIPPGYESHLDKRISSLKPGEKCEIDVGSESADVAFLTHFEIIMSYAGPNRAKFFSHFIVDGEVKKNDSGLNRARWTFTFPFACMWVRYFFDNPHFWKRQHDNR